jgi:hypothetical protein
MSLLRRPAMSKRLVLVSVALVGCLAATGICYLAWPRSTITEEAASRIHEGMTLAEAAEILGPPRDESTGPIAPRDYESSEPYPWFLAYPPQYIGPDGIAGPEPIEWRSDDVLVQLHIDDDGRIIYCQQTSVRRLPESPLATLRRWLRL